MTVEVPYFCSDKRRAAAADLEHVRRDCLKRRVRGNLQTSSKLKPHPLSGHDRCPLRIRRKGFLTPKNGAFEYGLLKTVLAMIVLRVQ